MLFHHSHFFKRQTLLSLFPILFLLVGGVFTGAVSAAELEWNVFIHDWQLIGPFPNGLGNDYLGGDSLPDISKTVEYNGQEFRWQPYNRGGINLETFFDPETNNDRVIAYAYTIIDCSEERDAVIACGFDDSARIYLNGEQVFEIQRNGGCTLDEFKAPIHLKKGENTLVLKIEEGSGSWEAIARIIPAGFENPLLTVGCELEKWHFISRPPVVQVELLDEDDNVIESHRCSGFRLNEGYTRFPLYAPTPKTEPASVRITLQSEFYKPFQKTYTWEEAQKDVLPITLEGNLQVPGRVVDADGKPIENVWFILDTNPLEIRSDSEGRFKLTGVEPTWCDLHIFAEGYKYKRQAYEFSEIQSVEITLEKGGHVLKGTVQDEDGNPIEGAVVGSSPCSTKTDAQGHFVLAGLRDDRFYTYPTITHPDFVSKRVSSQQLDTDCVTEVTYTLQKGGSVAGQVTATGSGDPIKDVQITFGDSRYISSSLRPSGSSDEDGHFLIKNIQPGQQIVHAISDDYAPVVQTTTVSTGKETKLDFQLEEGKDITGTVKDEEGNPVPGVQVISDTWKGYRMFERRGNTDEEGNFTLPHMPSDPVVIHMYKQGYISIRNINASGGDHHDVVLKKAFSCTVSVRLKDTGEAPDVLNVDQGNQWSGNSRISWHQDHRQREWDKKKGSLTFTFTEPIQAEKIMFRFRVPKYKEGIVEIPKSATQSITKDLILERAPDGLKGRVLSKKTNEPVKNLSVYVVNSNDRLRMDHYSDPRSALRSYTGVKTTTDDNGEFELSYFENIEGSMLALLPEKEGCALITDIQGAIVDGKLQLTLPEPGTIKGRATLAGEPVASETIHISWKPEGRDNYDFPFGYGNNTITDKEGKYEFSALPSGSYSINRVRSFDYPGGGGMNMYLGMNEIEVEEGGMTRFDFERPAGVTLKGRTMITSDIPVEGCFVTLMDSDRNRIDAVKCGENGVFEFIHAPTGALTLEAQLQSNRNFGTTRTGRGIASGRTTVTIDGPTSVDIPLTAANMEVHQFLTGMTGDIVGKKAPAFAGDIFGTDRTFDFTDQSGKNTVVVFWSSDNDKCIESLPAIKKIAETCQENDAVTLITISTDFEESDLKDAVDQHDLNFPVIFSGDGIFDEIFTLYGMKLLPSAVLIDAEGKFASDRIGIEEVQEKLNALINP